MWRTSTRPTPTRGEDLDVDDLKGLGKKKDSKATDESASVEGGAG